MMAAQEARYFEPIRDWLIARIADAAELNSSEVDTTALFHEFGIASSDAIEISGALSEFLGRELVPTLFYEHPTIDSMAEALAEEQQQAPGGVPAAEDEEPSSGDVCVIGMACRFPADATTPEGFWRNLLAGADGGSEVPAERWDIDAYYDPNPSAAGKQYTRRGGFVTDAVGFDAAFFGISPAEAMRMEPMQRMLLESTWAALEDAGIAPDRLRGSRTGVFVGQMTSQEYDRLQHDHDGAGALDDPYFGSGISPSVTAGRIAYLLDLRGPALCLDTACSSSLTALHLAVRSLQAGECDVAIVGGANAAMHPTGMTQACRAHMLSPDGRCKTFDASADGFLMGEGCGVVVLRRRSDALVGQNPVVATIRGTALNQDGRSNGMTAPNLGAQVKVINEALEAAGVAPEEVGYVEAHGSGTQLGDAIEIAALQQVFGAERPADQPLAVGAVKTNVGHLLGAAGMAGLIKTLLVLEHGQIPPNLHLEQRNPTVQWDRMPILLPDGVHDWPVPGKRRIAGVSSFGWSGTNVHLVLQSAEPRQQGSGAQDWHLLPISARSERALDELTGKLREELADPVGADLADTACTLQAGRAGLEYRRALVCKRLPDALDALRDSAPVHQVRPGTRLRTAFLFPGAGDQHADMARDIYQTEPVFAEVFDECAELIVQELGVDLRTVLFSAERQGGGGLAAMMNRDDGSTSDTGSELDRPEVAHAAVFAVEYSMAMLWQHWGVTPSALLGYSLGEFVAACVAGVFQLPDAMRLMARRGKVIGTTPPGVMLAVPLPVDEVHGMLPGELSLAARNGPSMTVVAGPADAVAAFESTLDDADVVHRRISAQHALHSSMLRPVHGEIAELVRAVPREAPEIPFVSSLSGTWITEAQAQDPEYWATQMCETVRFDDGLAELAGSGTAALLEIGPGQTLTSLSLQILGPKRRAETLCAPTMRVPHLTGSSDREQLLRALGEYWARGGSVDWPRVRERQPGRPKSLVTYPFDHQQRFTPGPAASDRSHPVASTVDTGKLADLAQWSHVPVWKQSFGTPEHADARGTWLVFADAERLYRPVVDELRGRGASVVTVWQGASFSQLATDEYLLDPGQPADYERLVQAIAESDRLPRHVLHAWTAPPSTADDQQDIGLYSVLDTVRALAGQLAGKPVSTTVLTSGLYRILGDEPTEPRRATMLGFARSVPHEFPGSTCRCIDVPSDELAEPRTVDALVAEICAESGNEQLAYRHGRRWVTGWEPTPIEGVRNEQIWRDGGVYVITGGLGGLGLAVARELAGAVRARLVLLGRTELDANSTDEGVRAKLAAVRELEQLGAEVLPIAVDIADSDALAAALARARERFGDPHGVIHTAGVPAGGLIQLKTRAEAAKVLRPKVAGTLALYECMRGVDLDFLALYSSSLVSSGGVGESDYCAANAFLDAFAWHARESGFPAYAIDWGPWLHDSWTEHGARGQSELVTAMAQLRERYGISDAEGVRMLGRVLASGLPEVLVSTQSPEILAAQWQGVISSATNKATVPERSHPRPALGTPYAAPRGATEQRIAKVWRRYLGLDRVGAHDHFFELGGNSLIGMTIVAELSKELDVGLRAAELFEAPTPATLAEAITSRGGDAPGTDNTRVSGSARAQRRKQLATATRRRGKRGGEESAR